MRYYYNCNESLKQDDGFGISEYNVAEGTFGTGEPALMVIQDDMPTWISASRAKEFGIGPEEAEARIRKGGYPSAEKPAK